MKIVENESNWITTKELVAYTKMCRKTAVKFAASADAIRRVSTRKNLYDKSAIDRALARL